MRAIVLDRPGARRDAELPDPAPRPTDIVVKAGDALDGGPFGVDGSPDGAAIRVSPPRVYNGELTIVGSTAVLRGFGPAAGLLGSGAVNPRALLSPPLPLGRSGKAVDRVGAGPWDHVAHPAVMTGAITSWACAGE